MLLRDSQGESVSEALEALLCPEIGLVSIMHRDVVDALPTLGTLAERWSGPTGCCPHRGVSPAQMSPRDLLADAKKWVARGAQVVGGCRGFGPEYIAALAAGPQCDT